MLLGHSHVAMTVQPISDECTPTHQPELAHSHVKQIREFFPIIIVDVERIPNFAILDNFDWKQSRNLDPPPRARQTTDLLFCPI